MKLYIIAGEASGDLHGSNLIKALKAQHPDLECRVWGGDLMEAAGATLVRHYRDLAFMGFAEVIANLRTILRNISFCKEDIVAFQPDAVIFIDYPGFNLRIAKWLRQEVNKGRLHAKSVYYIAPQIWAWHTSRVHDIKRDIDAVLVILPFEQAFYKKYGVDTHFVGHPLLDVIEPQSNASFQQSRQIALLPGSRLQEVKRILPVMLAVTPKFPQFEFVIAASGALPDEVYASFCAAYPNVRVERGKTYEILAESRAALVKSGTSTLETALIGTPQVVCYTGSRLSYEIARRLVKIGYISLVNLIADAPIVQELIQDQFNETALQTALEAILVPETAHKMQSEYQNVRSLLGNSGASGRAANVIIALTNPN